MLVGYQFEMLVRGLRQLCTATARGVARPCEIGLLSTNKHSMHAHIQTPPLPAQKIVTPGCMPSLIWSDLLRVHEIQKEKDSQVTMQLDSVMRKRRKKMKKHKLRKRRKREKAEKRKLSQGR